MNKKEITELFDFMTTANRTVFVNDFTGWGDEARIPGYAAYHSSEGNGIRSEATDAEYEPQYESVRRGNHLQVQLREDGRLVKEVVLGDVFPEHHVVITTGSEALRNIAPMCKRRSEVMDYMFMIFSYCRKRQDEGNPVPWYWENNMMELTKYLYQNCPDKTEDKSVYDRLFV